MEGQQWGGCQNGSKNQGIAQEQDGMDATAEGRDRERDSDGDGTSIVHDGDGDGPSIGHNRQRDGDREWRGKGG